MNQSPQLDQLFTALAKAQGEMSAAAKDCANPFFKSRYADLSSVWTACREPLSRNGLSVLQIVQSAEAGDVLHTTLGHSSGQYMTSTMPIRMAANKGGNDIQALGSTITYLRRYALSAIVGVAPDDDNDGNNSSYKAQPKQEAPKVHPIAQLAHSTDQVISQPELLSLLSKVALCGSDYTDTIMSWLAKQGIMSLDKLPVTLLDLVKRRIEKHLSEGAIKPINGEA